VYLNTLSMGMGKIYIYKRRDLVASCYDHRGIRKEAFLKEKEQTRDGKPEDISTGDSRLLKTRESGREGVMDFFHRKPSTERRH